MMYHLSEWPSSKNLQTVLERVWRKGNYSASLIERQIGTGTMEISMEAP